MLRLSVCTWLCWYFQSSAAAGGNIMTYGYWQDTRNRTCFGAPLTTVAAPCTASGPAHSVLTKCERFPIRLCALAQPRNRTIGPLRAMACSLAFSPCKYSKHWLRGPSQAAGTFTNTTLGRPHARGATSWTRASWPRVPSLPARPAPSSHLRAGGCACGALSTRAQAGVYVAWCPLQPAASCLLHFLSVKRARRVHCVVAATALACG